MVMQSPSLWTPSPSFSQWVPSLKIVSDPETGQGIIGFLFLSLTGTGFSLLIIHL